jgi:hypothetical protein
MLNAQSFMRLSGSLFFFVTLRDFFVALRVKIKGLAITRRNTKKSRRNTKNKFPNSKFKIQNLFPEHSAGVFLVQIKQILDPLGLVRERLGAVAEIDGFVKFLVGFHQRRRHGEGIV